ncbi:MAG: hypothetical protein MJ070_08240 [Lachnospiraceae bacterium]|nr:hypothetical protein [Lachnospiraceae bacterium]
MKNTVTALLILACLALFPFFVPAPYLPSDTAYVTEAGIAEEDGRLAVSVRIGNRVIGVTGENFPDAVKKLESAEGKRLFFRTAGAWVFSVRLSPEKRDEVLSCLLRSRETAARCLVFLTESDPAALLRVGGDLAGRVDRNADRHLGTSLHDVAEEDGDVLFFDRLTLKDTECLIGGALSFDGTVLSPEETAAEVLFLRGWEGNAVGCASGVCSVKAARRGDTVRGTLTPLSGGDPELLKREAEEVLRTRLLLLGHDLTVTLDVTGNGTVLE